MRSNKKYVINFFKEYYIIFILVPQRARSDLYILKYTDMLIIKKLRNTRKGSIKIANNLAEISKIQGVIYLKKRWVTNSTANSKLTILKIIHTANYQKHSNHPGPKPIIGPECFRTEN